MRNFRNAAIAGATAVALTFGGASVATAAEAPAKEDTTASSSSQDTGNNAQTAGLSSKIGHSIFGIEKQGDETDTLNGRNIFGSSKDHAAEPKAARVLYALTIVLGITAVGALLIAPIDNFIKYGPFAK